MTKIKKKKLFKIKKKEFEKDFLNVGEYIYLLQV